MRTLTIFEELGKIVQYTMMAKPMKTLELHYPMNQFFIIVNLNKYLQVCPTSSILTGAVKPCFKTHPLRRYVKLLGEIWEL